MKLDSIETWTERVPLTRPYTIAYERVDSVALAFVRIRSGAHAGLGCASPIREVTGEEFEECRAALGACEDAVLREAYAAHVSGIYGARIAVDETAITAGCNMAFFVAMLAIARAGDAILLPADFDAEWILAWGPVATRSAWRESAREGALALYRVAR